MVGKFGYKWMGFLLGVGRDQMEEMELPVYGNKARWADDSVARESMSLGCQTEDRFRSYDCHRC